MKTKKQFILELEASKSIYVTYGDDGVPVKRLKAIKDIKQMDDELLDFGDWYECDKTGSEI